MCLLGAGVRGLVRTGEDLKSCVDAAEVLEEHGVREEMYVHREI